jgi:hypothetical protein
LTGDHAVSRTLTAAVAVEVALHRVVAGGAVVAQIAEAVAVEILLAGIGDDETVVACVPTRPRRCRSDVVLNVARQLSHAL